MFINGFWSEEYEDSASGWLKERGCFYLVVLSNFIELQRAILLSELEELTSLRSVELQRYSARLKPNQAR